MEFKIIVQNGFTPCHWYGSPNKSESQNIQHTGRLESMRVGKRQEDGNELHP